MYDTVVHLIDPEKQPDASKLPQRTAWKSDQRTGEQVWPYHVETYLVEALEEYAKYLSSRDKSKKPKGRDKFISNYILEKSGLRRTTKQISSRLQQIHNHGKNTYLKELIYKVSPRRSTKQRAPTSSMEVGMSTAIPVGQDILAGHSTPAPWASPSEHPPSASWVGEWQNIEEEAGPSQQFPKVPSVMVQGDHDLQLAQVASSSTAAWTSANEEVPDIGLLNLWDNAPFISPYQDFDLLGPIGSSDHYGRLYPSAPHLGPATSPYDHNNALCLDLEWNNNLHAAYMGPDSNPHIPYIAFPGTGSSTDNPSYHTDQRH